MSEDKNWASLVNTRSGRPDIRQVREMVGANQGKDVGDDGRLNRAEEDLVAAVASGFILDGIAFVRARAGIEYKEAYSAAMGVDAATTQTKLNTVIDNLEKLFQGQRKGQTPD